MMEATVICRHLPLRIIVTTMMMVILLHTNHSGASDTSSLMGNGTTNSILLAHQYPELELLYDSEPSRRILGGHFVTPPTKNPGKPVCVIHCPGGQTGATVHCDTFNRDCHRAH